MYNRFDKGMHPKQCVLDYLLSCMSQKVKLEDNASELENKLPFLDGPLPSEGSSSSKVRHAASKTPMLNTPEGYEGEPPPVLSNGASVGDVDVPSGVEQKHKENLRHHRDLQDLNDTPGVVDSEVKGGKPQHH